MSLRPLEIELTSHASLEWLNSLRWVNAAHYELKVGVGDLRENCRVMGNGRLLFHLIPSVLPSHQRRELFRLLLAVARNKAAITRRLKNVGGGRHPLTQAGTPSVYARPRKLKILRN